MSAIGMLGTPSEMYKYGSQFGGILFSFPLMMYSVIYWYFPVFYKLEVSTSYEVILVKEFGFKSLKSTKNKVVEIRISRKLCLM